MIIIYTRIYIRMWNDMNVPCDKLLRQLFDNHVNDIEYVWNIIIKYYYRLTELTYWTKIKAFFKKHGYVIYCLVFLGFPKANYIDWINPNAAIAYMRYKDYKSLLFEKAKAAKAAKAKEILNNKRNYINNYALATNAFSKFILP